MRIFSLCISVMAESQVRSHAGKVDCDDDVLEGEEAETLNNFTRKEYVQFILVRGWFKSIQNCKETAWL